MKRRTAFKPLRVHLSEIQDPEIRAKIEHKFEEVKFQQTQMIEKQRAVVRAQSEAEVALAQFKIAVVGLLELAGEYLDPIKTEQVWVPYRKEGDIVFECPFSEQDMRNAMKLQRANMEKQAQDLDTGDDLYEGGEDEEK